MAKKMAGEKPGTGLSLEQIKRIAVTAMFADDEMFENLVLKGGNALSRRMKESSRVKVHESRIHQREVVRVNIATIA